MQDIAGCRIVVVSIEAQDRAVRTVSSVFGNVSVVDRRTRPSHGYRAVHVIVKSNETLVEVQVRTALQHLWAELSEKLADTIDPALKYGGGPEALQSGLTQLAAQIRTVETMETEIIPPLRSVAALAAMPEDVRNNVVAIIKRIEDSKETARSVLEQLVARASREGNA
jgi:ppGpp synthetase/RelA/SpoT-type nucleotidyltranferase